MRLSLTTRSITDTFPFAGAISTAVLPVRKITQLHNMMVNVLTLLAHLCDRLLREHHWNQSVGEEEVSHFIPDILLYTLPFVYYMVVL